MSITGTDSDLDSFAKVIDLWESGEVLADELGLRGQYRGYRVRNWKPRGIPGEFWDRVGSMRDDGECEAAAGDAGGILGHHWFADLAAHRRGNDGIPAGVACEASLSMEMPLFHRSQP